MLIQGCNVKAVKADLVKNRVTITFDAFLDQQMQSCM